MKTYPELDKRLKSARLHILRHPKFAVYSGVIALGKTEVTADHPAMQANNIKTACTDGYNKYFHPDFIIGLTDKQLRFLVLHEAVHIACEHTFVWRKMFDQHAQLANVAADFYVNQHLVDLDPEKSFIEMPKGGCIDAKYRGMSVGQIWRALLKEFEQNGGKIIYIAMDSVLAPEGEKGDGKSSAENGQGLRQMKIRSELRAGKANAALMGNDNQGNGKGGLDRSIDDLNVSQIPWNERLRDILTEVGIPGYEMSTWRRVNRRSASNDLYMPGWQGVAAKRIVVIADTSGSVGGDELICFLSEVGGIIQQVVPEQTDILWVDAEVCQHDTLTPDQYSDFQHQVKPKGGGGTNMVAGLDYIVANKMDVGAVIVLTDGYTPFPRQEFHVPVIWVITSNVVAPTGVTLKLEIDYS